MTPDWNILIPAIVAGAPATIAAIAALIASLRTKNSVNGRMDELLKLNRTEAFKEGADAQLISDIKHAAKQSPHDVLAPLLKKKP